MTRALVIVGFLVSLAAGVTVGLSVSERAHHEPPPKPVGGPGDGPRERGGGGWLAQQLSLTPEQQTQLDAIWSEVARHGGREQWSERSRLRKERDEAIAALIAPERQPEYEQIHRQYDERVEAMEAQWRGNFQQAVEKTKAILTPEQREKYEAILARHDRDRDRNGPPGSRDRKPSTKRDRDDSDARTMPDR